MDWREAAFDVYREAWSELLARWQGIRSPSTEFYIDELTEALLDLKQATLVGDQMRDAND
jgi:hypothetical protein